MTTDSTAGTVAAGGPPAGSGAPGAPAGDRPARGSHGPDDRPAWRRPTAGENRFASGVAVAVVVAVQLLLPSGLSPQPQWLLPVVEIAAVVVSVIGNPVRLEREATILRATAILLVSAMTVATVTSAGLLAARIIGGHEKAGAPGLLAAGGAIYLTNVVVFAFWFWDLDRGGPVARAKGTRQHTDFLFPQMTAPDVAPPHWEPQYVDYLYLSFTNSTAFSPTDTMPLSRWAKLLMSLQSLVALSTVALVVARAVNVLPQP